ncbi:MAG: TonB-dependent receptor [bacterium]
MKKILLGFLVIGCSIFGSEGTITVVGEEIVVTASRSEEKVKEIPTSVTVITREEIERSGAERVIEALRGMPGLDIVETGVLGGIASCFLRGAKSEHTLVMIDGVEVNDPISAGRGFNFAHLPLAGVERIEIVRGPQGILYGSDAIGGVINIITKKGEKPSFSSSAKGGQYNTYQERAEIGGRAGLLDYAFSVSRQDSGGISKAAEGTETDGYHATTILGNLGFSPSQQVRAGISAYYNKADFDIDDGASDDDPNYTSKSESLAIKGGLEATPTLWLKEKVDLSLHKVRREYEDGTDTIEPLNSSSSWCEGKNTKVTWQQNLSREIEPLDIGLVSGIEYEKEEGKSYYHSESEWGPWTDEFKKKKETNTGYYLQGELKGENLAFWAGLRLDDHSRFGQKTTYKVSSLWVTEKTKIRANYATGFKAPSLYQLHSSYGDPNLKPDESIGYEIGIEQEIGERMLLGLTCFQNEFKNMIDFDHSSWKYKNIGQAETGGVEILFHIRPTSDLKVKVNYTYTQTEDKDTGKELLRRPKQKAAFTLGYSLKNTHINLDCIYVGERKDIGYTILSPYTLVNLNTSYNLTDWLSLFLGVENIFGTEYEEVKGYSTFGRFFYAGTKIDFPKSKKAKVKLERPKQTESEKPKQTVVVKEERAGIWKEPGTYQLITTVNKGRELEVLERSEEYYKVRLSDGRVGWIYSFFVQ